MGIPQAFGDILRPGQLGAGNGGAACEVVGYHLLREDLLVQVLGQADHLHLVEVGDRRDRPVDIAVQGGVPESGLGLVSVVREDQPELRRDAGQDVGPANARLDVLVDEPGVLSGPTPVLHVPDLVSNRVVQILDATTDEVYAQALTHLPGVALGNG